MKETSAPSLWRIIITTDLRGRDDAVERLKMDWSVRIQLDGKKSLVREILVID